MIVHLLTNDWPMNRGVIVHLLAKEWRCDCALIGQVIVVIVK